MKSSSPWSSDREKFLALLFASRLFDLHGLEAAIEGQQTSDLAQLCEHLMSRDLLTKWQCDKLRNGQYKGFFLGGFRILDHVSEEGCLYRAEECSTRRKVTLSVQPNAEWPGGIEYRVVD
jgi:eukaryotic-like serine/threonine-protein kinase